VIVVRSVSEIRKVVSSQRRDGKSIGLVPTMGALHDGHLSLVDASKKECDLTVATIFVNPLQFGPQEDYASYPRDEDTDSRRLVSRGCDVLFAPTVRDVFSNGVFDLTAYPTVVTVRRLTDGLCGRTRPGHFDGVTTEVLKFLLMTLPDVAYFGEKDFQQLRVVAQMVADLDVPVRIQSVPTAREPDGLAMSSRNSYLTAGEREVAPQLHRSLLSIAERCRKGAACADVCASERRRLLGVGFRAIDYLEVVDVQTLSPVDSVTKPSRAMAAAWLGRARLIDNVPI